MFPRCQRGSLRIVKLTLPCITCTSAIAVIILALALPSCERKSEPHPKVIVLGAWMHEVNTTLEQKDLPLLLQELQKAMK